MVFAVKCASVCTVLSLSGCGGGVQRNLPADEGAAASSGATGDGGGGNAAVGGSGSGGQGGGVPTAYTLSEYVGPEIWTWLVRTAAVDSQERLYVTDGQIVYLITDGVPSVYLTFDEIAAAVEPLPEQEPSLIQIPSLDVGPDGRLYLLVDWSPNRVLVSDGPHSVVRLYDDLLIDSGKRLGAESAERGLLVAAGGIYEAGPGKPPPLYSYDDLPMQAIGLGDAGDFTVDHQGRFFLVAGAPGTPLTRGSTDGSGVEVVIDSEHLDISGPGFSSAAIHPSGGVVAPLGRSLYHIAEDGSPTELSTAPTLTEMAEQVNSALDSTIARIGPSRSIYLLDGYTIYRAAPIAQ